MTSKSIDLKTDIPHTVKLTTNDAYTFDEKISQYSTQTGKELILHQAVASEMASIQDKRFNDCSSERFSIVDSKPDVIQSKSVELDGNQMAPKQTTSVDSRRALLERPVTRNIEAKKFFSDVRRKVLELHRDLSGKQGVHSIICMKAAGFHYTNIRDTARCDRCQLEVSEWTLDMNPFSIHSDRSPNCPFVHSLKAPNFGSQLLPSSVMAATLQIPAINIDESENSCKRQKLEVSSDKVQIQTLFETELIKKIRRRTFSHWPHKKSPSRAQMIEAGFFHCNVGDRVICLYCNLICQQWTPNADDPWLVHKTLSSKCPYVIDVLVRRGTTSLVILNENPSSNQTSSVAATEGFRSNGIVSTTACHSTYMEIPRRYASFANWSSEQLPNIDDLVRAGFFYTGINTIVTCFYCNGSLQNWGPNDNPMIEHARWFPHCAYAKQLCGDDLYQKIQHSKRLTQG
ncbi:unnamed protein product [Rotaria sp. Silwood2]|nr:unnamed protein product [Rotaria sp. Silwood2]CAF3122447.1 unnamed protein product [Rotaria sp. Silwood2]CAF4432782.1 unnamed protein product [Rotaria sp. Silwood2]